MARRIDYDGHPEAAEEMQRFIQEGLGRLMGVEVNQDWVDSVMFLTARQNEVDSARLREEVQLLVEVG